MELIEICHKRKSLWQNTLTGIQLVVSVTGFTFSLYVYLLTSNLKFGFFMIWCHAFLCFAALLLLICLLKQYSGRGWLIGHIVFVAIGLLIVTVGTPEDAALAANITETDFSRCVHSNSSGTSVCGATFDLSSLSQSKNTCVLSYPANTCYCCYLFYRRNCSLELEGQTVSYEGATSCEQVQHILQPVLWVYVVICNINFCIALVALLMVFIHYMNYEPAVVPLAYALSDINEEPAVIDEAAAPDITCTQQQTVHHDPQPINPPQMHYYPQPIKPPAYDAPSHPPRRPFRVCRSTDTPRATVPSRQNIYTIPTSTSQLPTGDQHYNPNPITPPAYDAPSHPPRRPFRVCRPIDTPRATVLSRQNIYTIPTSTSQLSTRDQHHNPNPITPPAYDAPSHPPRRPFRVCRPTDTPRATVPSRQNIYTIPTSTSQLPTGDQHYNPNPIIPPAYDAPSHPPPCPFRVCRPTDTPRAIVPSRQNIYTIPTSTSQLSTRDQHHNPNPITPPAYDAPSHPPRRPFRVCRPIDTPRATVLSRQNIYTIPTSTSQLSTRDQHHNPNPITPPAYDAPSHPPRRPFRVCRPTDTPRATVPSRQNIYTIPTSTSQLPIGDQHYNPNPITPPAYDARSHPPPRPFRVCRPTDTPRATVPSRQNIYTIPTCTSQLPTGGATNQNATMATDDSNIVYSHTPPPPYSP